MSNIIIEKELKELHEDLEAIKEKSPNMILVASGVIKGIRISTEAAASIQNSPKYKAKG